MTNKKTTIEIFTEKTLTANTDRRRRSCPDHPAGDEQTGSKRPKLNLSMVLDRSGSMSGRKIEEARMPRSIALTSCSQPIASVR
jgi:hypothetical protein